VTTIGKIPVGAGLFVEARAALPDTIRNENAPAVGIAFHASARCIF
jgi:hypothetical protein